MAYLEDLLGDDYDPYRLNDDYQDPQNVPPPVKEPVKPPITVKIKKKKSDVSKKPFKHRMFKPGFYENIICHCRRCKGDPEGLHVRARYYPPKEILTDQDLIDMVE